METGDGTGGGAVETGDEMRMRMKLQYFDGAPRPIIACLWWSGRWVVLDWAGLRSIDIDIDIDMDRLGDVSMRGD